MQLSYIIYTYMTLLRVCLHTNKSLICVYIPPGFLFVSSSLIQCTCSHLCFFAAMAFFAVMVLILPVALD